MSMPLGHARAAPRRATSREQRNGNALQWYCLLTLLIIFGWLIRDHNLISPEFGIGYWLGIIGGSMMALLLMYPLRKRFRFLGLLGETKYWFRLHMIFGLLGPLLIFFHSNFRLGSFNSRVAFYAMLLVAGSGIIGRHFYAGIHRGLYGRKTSLRELQNDLADAIKKSHGLARIMPRCLDGGTPGRRGTAHDRGGPQSQVDVHALAPAPVTALDRKQGAAGGFDRVPRYRTR